jgi:hypothetical protein
MLAQAINSTNPEAANSTMSPKRDVPAICSDIGITMAPTFRLLAG